MKKRLFTLAQCTWGLPQTLLGLAVFTAQHQRKCPYFTYRGTVVTQWRKRGKSMSLGPFLFVGEHMELPPTAAGFSQTQFSRLLVHEYGHAIQSAILGPLYLPLIGIPSLIWANTAVCSARRRTRSISYYAFPPEASANFLGEWALRRPSMGLAIVD